MSGNTDTPDGTDPTDEGTSGTERPPEIPEDVEPLGEVPDWDDEYLDRVSDRLMFNYDLDRDTVVHGEQFPMTGTLEVHSQKQFFHPALSYGHHESEEYLFVRRLARPTVADLERLVELGHRIADERVVADEEHFSTDVTFVVVAEDLADDVAAFVADHEDRTLLKYGYYGHYEVNLAVVVPEAERLVRSPSADTAEAFALWEPLTEEKGLFGRLLDAIRPG
ncbi:hypothetical protein [Salinirubrum litoreum]|uniref:DUF8052 domain-containing protein n=1 Tax=Salinirubrum litoreum TaxID=1126234 RepID=A0ABD5RE73_9EURY|nr:hypothetical protein [Salinirubrum litoreum]